MLPCFEVYLLPRPFKAGNNNMKWKMALTGFLLFCKNHDKKIIAEYQQLQFYTDEF